jgi:hypothetical protein
MSELGSYKVPIFCPICNRLMKGKSTQSFYRWGCCVVCQIEFIEDGREERWRNGWRPSPEEVEAYLKRIDSE